MFFHNRFLCLLVGQLAEVTTTKKRKEMAGKQKWTKAKIRRTFSEGYGDGFLAH